MIEVGSGFGSKIAARMTGVSAALIALAALVGCSVPTTDNSAQGSAQASTYSLSCQSMSLSGQYMLEAQCYDLAGTLKTSPMLDLNADIVNDNGVIAWQSAGNFGPSCGTCELQAGHFLVCSCTTAAGAQNTSSLDLNERISNVDGALAFDAVAAEREERLLPTEPAAAQ